MTDNNKIMSNESTLKPLSHHLQQKLCQTRPPYRQGKKLTAVKIYTINDESQHLMICGVPQLQLRQEVKKLVFPYGVVKKVHIVSDYPKEEFTEAYHIHYEDIRSARIAKHFLDGKNFYGGILHVFYVPELESVGETRAKLVQRCKDVSVRIKRNKQESLNSQANRLATLESSQKEETVNQPQFSIDQLSEDTHQAIHSGFFANQQSHYTSNVSVEWKSTQESVAITANTNNINDDGNPAEVTKDYDKSKKRKNYKGQSIRNNVKVKVVRPQIVDTSIILKHDIKDTKVSTTPNVEKNTLIIKKISNNDVNKKRIIIKDSSIKQLIQPSRDLQSSIQTVKFQIRSTLQNCEKIHLCLN